MAARKLAEKNGEGKKTYNFFTFDIWKSQGSGFRRSFLEHFLNWAQLTFPKKRYELAAIEAQIQGKTREIQTNNQPILDWYGIGVLVFLPFLPLYYFWAKTVFDKAAKAGSTGDFLFSAPFLLLLAFVIATLALAGDLPPAGPSLMTRVCGFGLDSCRFRAGQARRARSPQIAQASGALRPVFCSRAMSVA